MKPFLKLCLASLLLSFYACHAETGWIQTVEGYEFWGEKRSETALYSWEGDAQGDLIHGHGTLTVYDDNGAFNESKNIDAYLGSTNPSAWKMVPEGRFLGQLDENLPEGFGVFDRGNGRIEIGKYQKGALNGSAIIYEKGQLVYKGIMKNGYYHGDGILFQSGNATIGSWRKGKIEKPFVASVGGEINRLWNHVAGNSEENNTYQPEDLTSYVQGKSIFYDSLATQIYAYIENRTESVVQQQTAFWSWHPIRMFWHSIFTPQVDRMAYWQQALEDGGLSYIDLEALINTKITKYNEQVGKSEKLQFVKLSPFEKEEIVDDELFGLINDREIAGWQDNLWFDIALAFLIGFCIPYVIGFIIGCFIPPLLPFIFAWGWVVDLVFTILGAIIGLGFFVVGIFAGNINTEIVSALIDNYVQYLVNQNIF